MDLEVAHLSGDMHLRKLAKQRISCTWNGWEILKKSWLAVYFATGDHKGGSKIAKHYYHQHLPTNPFGNSENDLHCWWTCIRILHQFEGIVILSLWCFYFQFSTGLTSQRWCSMFSINNMISTSCHIQKKSKRSMWLQYNESTSTSWKLTQETEKKYILNFSRIFFRREVPRLQ